jgi:hypothetical protein
MVTAFSNLDIGVMTRGQLDSAGWKERLKRIVSRRQRAMDCLHHVIWGMGASNREQARKALAKIMCFRAETPGNNHIAILGQRFFNRTQRFFNRRLDEATSVDNDQIGTIKTVGYIVTLCAKTTENTFRVD